MTTEILFAVVALVVLAATGGLAYLVPRHRRRRLKSGPPPDLLFDAEDAAEATQAAAAEPEGAAVEYATGETAAPAPPPVAAPAPAQSGAIAEMPAGAVVDQVHFSITAPSLLRPGAPSEVIFWSHLERQWKDVIERASLALGTKKIAYKSEGPFDVSRGTVLWVSLEVEGLQVEPHAKPVLWKGGIGNAGFLVAVPEGAREGPRRASASIRVGGGEIAHMDFLLTVGAGRPKAKRVKASVRVHKTAFASYASEDRDAVLARLQGISKTAPNLEVFLDVISLRSGQYWARELETRIPASDVFYLFWSRNASESEWVEKEWRCAYSAKGLDFIDPVPLEPPSVAPPPAELGSKHFNDRWLVLMGAGRSRGAGAPGD